MTETDAFEMFCDLNPDRRLVDATGSEAIGQVVEDRLVGKQGVILKYHADITSVDRLARNVLLIEQEAPGVGFDEPGNGAKKRGLSASARPEQREEFAVRDREIHALQDDRSTERLRDTVDRYGRHLRSSPSYRRPTKM